MPDPSPNANSGASLLFIISSTIFFITRYVKIARIVHKVYLSTSSVSQLVL
jgi:hypothetical protein